MRVKHTLDVTPDPSEHPGAVIVMTETVEDNHLEDLVVFRPEHTEYVFSVDGREYSPAQFLRILRRGVKLNELEEYGQNHRPGWKFVVDGKTL